MLRVWVGDLWRLQPILTDYLHRHTTPQLRSGAEIKKLFSEATQSRHISGGGGGVQSSAAAASAFLAPAAASAPSP